MSSVTCITFEEELNKNPELKISDIQILREWCEKQPHLPKIQDVQLAIFLYSNYYRIESTKKRIENYYTYRTHLPDFFSNRDLRHMKELQNTCKVLATLYLEKPTKEGYKISMARLLDFKPSHYFINDIIKYCLMVSDEFIWTQGSTSGHVWILDFTGITMGHVGRLSPVIMKKFIYYLQDAIPVRLMSCHIINQSPVVEIIFNIIKPFLKDEMIKITYFHSSLESAKQYFPIDALPNELGGKAGAIQELQDAQVKKIQNFHQWYLEDESINRVNESLRIGKSKTSSDLFGMEGSFKKLDID